MTIGQRIAQCRKQLGISQEALGEKLDVSRQAISKWEGDAALPEIDKLIALSRLFGVTVGWLLGVEEPSPREQEPLTEEQLNAMEQLVKLYTTQEKPAPKPDRRPIVLSALALVLAAAALLSCLSHHTNLSNSLSSLSYQLMGLQGSHDSLRSQLNDLQTAGTALGTPDALHKFSFQLIPSTTEPTVTVQLTAAPKQHSNETAELFVRKNGEDAGYAECHWDGTAYVAQLELPLENGYEYWLTITDLQGNQQPIPLEDAHAQNLKTSFQMTFKVGEPGHLTYQNGELVLHDLHFSLYRPDYLADGTLTCWNSIELLLVSGGETIARNALVSEADDLEFRQSFGYDSGFSSLPFPNVEIAEGEGVDIWIRATLSNGMELLEMISSWGYRDGTFYGSELAERVIK